MYLTEKQILKHESLENLQALIKWLLDFIFFK